MLVQYAFFFLLLLPLLTLSSPKPGCPTGCGDLEVPFPFGLGLGSNCSIDPSLDIHCNTSLSPPKAYLSTTTIEVVEFSGTQVRVKYPNLAFTCYDLSDSNATTLERSDLDIDLSLTPYTLSEDNWLTAIGCDDLVTIRGKTVPDFGGGCLSFCSHRNDSGGNGSCPHYSDGYLPRNGCCRTPIPRGTNVLGAYLSDLHGNWRKSKLFSCSYAFVGEKGKGFSFRLDDLLNNMTAFLNHNPTLTSTSLLLDWRIGTDNCSIARTSTAFACQENSVCRDADNGGYYCSCGVGYRGNPYLTQGCQDIDECKELNTNPCREFICINTLGSYECACPKGYYRDDRKNGMSCHKGSQSNIINVSLGMGVAMGSLILVSICYWLRKVLRERAIKKRKAKFFKRNGGLLLLHQQQQTKEGEIAKTKLFVAKELDKATDNFNESRVLGQGGQGTVYKGMLSNGQIVAIKKSKQVDENQLEQFINEVVILSQINHRNVVKLLGCCLETEVPLLVYEFVPNGTLFDLIHGPNSEFPITWNMRLKISSDVAGAFAYLHSASSLPIYHRDIKSSNILLDEKYVAKVSDFGISRSVALDQTHLTTAVRGTFGYFDPEYFQSCQFTEKSDVYSFGVVLVELLTGQRPLSSSRTDEVTGLAARFLTSMERDCLDEILDDQVLREGKKEEVVAVSGLAQRCLNMKGIMRPTMKQVAMELESVRTSQMPPTATASSVIRDGFFETNTTMMFSDFGHLPTTTSGESVASSSSDAQPFLFETM